MDISETNSFDEIKEIIKVKNGVAGSDQVTTPGSPPGVIRGVFRLFSKYISAFS